MAEQTPRTLNHFAFFSFRDAYFELSSFQRKGFHSEWSQKLGQAAGHFDIYQVYPTSSGADILVWSVFDANDPAASAVFFERFACATNPYRHLVQTTQVLWGFTRPSQYTKARSSQEIDPFETRRKPYLIIYPFVKTHDWYRMSKDARQGMMNEHIRIGKQYPDITQLLLYSFGLQDQEFIVVYETDQLVLFSDLVYELRESEARRFTERDTPVYTGVYHSSEETLGLWE